MTSIEIEQTVKDEFRNIQSFRYRNVNDVATCLVKPYKELCVSRYQDSEWVFEVWVIFEEQPTKKVGYVIAFEEEEISEHPYILAIWNREKTSLDYIHHQSNFLETFEGM